MNDTHYKFEEGDRVRLKNDRADVYPRAFGGSEGIVRQRKLDTLGHHKMVFVEWDTQHWTYNGEQNMWAFEDHFDPVERLDMPEEEKPDFMDALKQLIERYHPEGEAEAPPVDDQDFEKKHQEILEEAFDYASESEAVIIIGVKRQHHPAGGENGSILIPNVFSSYKTEEAGLLLESQITQVAAVAHQELALETIRKLLSERNG